MVEEGKEGGILCTKEKQRKFYDFLWDIDWWLTHGKHYYCYNNNNNINDDNYS